MNYGWDMAAYMGIRAERALEVVSHNLANASTLGFKRQLLNVWQLAPGASPAPGQAGPSYYVDVVGRDFSQGPLHNTENEADLALEGPGFFKVQTSRGLRYTRNGAFRLTPDRQLVTAEGHPVLGKNGPLTLDSRDQQFGVDAQGGIHLDGNLADQLAVVEFDNPQDLRPEGQNYLAAGPDAGEEKEAKSTRVLQGMVEEANIEATAETINLIAIQRSFEAYMKVLDTFAASDRKVMEDIGQG